MNIQFTGEIYKSIDPLAMDLMKRMLAKNASERIKAYQALNHPFLNKIGDDKTPCSPVLTIGSVKSKKKFFLF
jgi:serine/threonine protein kinase